jgi:two-component system, OmpR family, response regulator BaeR
MTNPRLVLVVEDDPKIAQLLLDDLRADGFDATTVGDSQVALRQIEQLPPAPVILDLMLPGVCRAVRRAEGHLPATVPPWQVDDEGLRIAWQSQ